MSGGSAGEVHSLHPGVFVLKWFLSFQLPAECHVQMICLRKCAGQTYRDSLALVVVYSGQHFNPWDGAAGKAWELRAGSPHSSPQGQPRLTELRDSSVLMHI